MGLEATHNYSQIIMGDMGRKRPVFSLYLLLFYCHFVFYCNLLSISISMYNVSINSYFYRTQVYLGSDLWVLMSLTPTRFSFRNLTDVTLADEDTNSIQTDDVNMAIQGKVAMQVVPSGGQICN